MPLTDLLVREAIQNSVDAAERSGSAPRVVFWERKLTGHEKAKLLKTLQVDEPMAARAVQAEGAAQSCDPDSVAAWSDLHKSSTDLSILYIEDFNGPGLRGKHFDVASARSWWRYYVNWHGESDKGDGTSGSIGGSHGKGKMAVVANSAIFTVLVYSEVDRHAIPLSDHDAAFIGLTYLPAHNYEDQVLTGRVMLGEERQGSVFPMVDEEARALAEVVGFRRKPGQTGLSLAVLASRSTASEVALAIERNWWPRFATPGRLTVEVQDVNGCDLPLDYSQQEWIHRYVEAYRAILEGTSNPQVKIKPLSRYSNLQLGTVAVRLVKEGDPAGDPSYRSKLACLRSVGMVVKYDGPIAGVPFHGVFIAHDDVDLILRKAEPVAHDGWSEGTVGLTKTENAFVRMVVSRSRLACEKLVAPSEETSTQDGGGRLIDEVLGGVFGASDLGKRPGPKHTSDPWEIHGPTTTLNENGNTLSRVDIWTVALKPDHPHSKVRIEPKFWYLSDIVGSRERDTSVVPRFLKVSVQEGGSLQPRPEFSNEPSLMFELTPGSKLLLNVGMDGLDAGSAHEVGLHVSEVKLK